MKRKMLFMLVMIAGVTALSGCGMEREFITPESQGVWNHYFVYPFSWVLTQLALFFQGNYGLAIVVATIAVRLLLVPLFAKQQRSSHEMKKIQPQMKEIQKKYNMKDQTEAQKYQQEVMKLYQTSGVNPIAGCLPILIQMPILMAFYFAIVRTEAIAGHSFLWMNLGDPDPYFIMPLLAGAAVFLQTKVTSGGQEMPDMMKPMLYLMPVMIIIAGIALPSALSLYWVTGGIFMIVQAAIFKKKREKWEQEPVK